MRSSTNSLSSRSAWTLLVKNNTGPMVAVIQRTSSMNRVEDKTAMMNMTTP